MNKINVNLKTLPKDIQMIIGDRQATENTYGWSTSRIFDYGDMILKISPISIESQNEIRMLDFMSPYGLTPKALMVVQSKSLHYLLMDKISGHALFEKSHTDDPESLVRKIAESLKRLWYIPIEHCPSDQTFEAKLVLAKRNIELNLISSKSEWDQDIVKGRFETPMEIYEYLKARKHPKETYVLSHGDFCLPNIIYEEDTFKGFIDMGRSGYGSKYQDIALALRSMICNIGSDQYHQSLMDLLDVPYDASLIDDYQLLDELF